jgi:hypothetical protein
MAHCEKASKHHKQQTAYHWNEYFHHVEQIVQKIFDPRSVVRECPRFSELTFEPGIRSSDYSQYCRECWNFHFVGQERTVGKQTVKKRSYKVVAKYCTEAVHRPLVAVPPGQ